MIEVVFNDSIKGSLKVAKSFSKDDMLNGAIGYIGEKPTKDEFNRLLNRMSQGERVPGKSSDVLCLGFSLDIGAINCDINGEKRKDVFTELFGIVDFNNDEIDKFFSNQVEDLNKIISGAKSGEPIRVWTSNAPFSACGYSYLCHILKDINCDLRVITLPSYNQTAVDTITSYTSWGEIAANEFYNFLPLERRVSLIEKQLQRNLWNNLVAENAPLRAVVNGKLISVPDTFYDHLIVKNIPSGEFIMAKLIGKLVGKYQLGVPDGWFALRIERMIDENTLEVVAEGDNRYGRILRRQ